MRANASNRRRFLAGTAVVATTGLAGCLGGGSDGGNDDSRPPATEGRSGTTSGDDADVAAEGTTEPSSPDGPDTPARESPRAVSFEAPHGTTIHATAYGGGNCGVVLVPQVNLDRESWRPQAEAIAGMGHRALAIDEDPDDRAASVRGAVGHLREAGVSTLVLLGASTGGEAVVAANATTDATVDGTITLSAAGGAKYASDLQGRSLFVVSEDDEERFVRVARELHRGAPDPKTLVEYEGSAHGQRIFESEHGEDLRGRIRTFLDDVCGN